MKIDDEMIGRSIKLARLHRDKSQQWLADEIGVTYQQVQKYEAGTNRVTLKAFLEIAKALEIGQAALIAGWIKKTAGL
jgi:transcriptional regulator with XRE-family HTH domain